MEYGVHVHYWYSVLFTPCVVLDLVYSVLRTTQGANPKTHKTIENVGGLQGAGSQATDPETVLLRWKRDCPTAASGTLKEAGHRPCPTNIIVGDPSWNSKRESTRRKGLAW
jgi:hypothetical protein